MRFPHFSVLFVLTLSVLVSPPASANTVAVFPCQTKPSANGTCPAANTPGQTRSIGANDYYDISIESTCIDQPDSWWKKKLVSFNVAVTVGSNTPINIPVFAERAQGAGCRIGVNGFPVMTSIPSNGQQLTLKVSVIRSDASDGLKQILSFASATSQDASLSTYAAAAVPYMGLAVSMANAAYKAFGQSNTPWLSTAPTALHPTGPRPDRFDLQDGYLVQYSGPDNPTDTDLYVDSGELKWRRDDSLLRGSSTWVLFKIEKYPRRNDFPTRSWYLNWEKLLEDTLTGGVAADAFKSRYQQVVTLLQNDPDFTSGDRRQYINSFTSIRDSILIELTKPNPDYNKIKDSIGASRERVQHAQDIVDGKRITAVNTKAPVSTLHDMEGALHVAIVPEKLANELQKREKP